MGQSQRLFLIVIAVAIFSFTIGGVGVYVWSRLNSQTTVERFQQTTSPNTRVSTVTSPAVSLSPTKGAYIRSLNLSLQLPADWWIREYSISDVHTGKSGIKCGGIMMTLKNRLDSQDTKKHEIISICKGSKKVGSYARKIGSFLFPELSEINIGGQIVKGTPYVNADGDMGGLVKTDYIVYHLEPEYEVILSLYEEKKATYCVDTNSAYTKEGCLEDTRCTYRVNCSDFKSTLLSHYITTKDDLELALEVLRSLSFSLRDST